MRTEPNKPGRPRPKPGGVGRNDAVALIREFAEALARSSRPAALLPAWAERTMYALGCRAMLCYAAPNAADVLLLEAVAGVDRKQLAGWETMDPGPPRQELVIAARRTTRARIFAPGPEMLRALGLHAALRQPLVIAGGVRGELWFGAAGRRTFRQADRDLVATLAQLAAAAIEGVAIRSTLGAAADTARQASLAKSEFLANMSHEIRTPMTAILGYADLLADPGLTLEEQQGYVTTIQRNGEALLQVINDILDLSKIEAGKLTLECVPCAPRKILDDVLGLMRGRAEQKGLEIALLDRTPAGVTLDSDPTRLRQILVNLLGNAIKFTERGGVRVELHLVEDPPGAAQLAVSVADTGIGIRAEDLARLFQPLTQLEASTARRFGGTGLGLAISRRLAELLGGDIAVERTWGAGSRFTLTLPVGAPDRAGGSATETARQPSATARPRAQQPARILVTDDAADNRDLLRTVLQRTGYLVETLASGVATLDRLADADAAPVDLLLLDMQMPGLDGYATAQRLRQAGWDGPIVALTAHALAGARQRCLEAGCNDYLVKPLQRTALLQTIARYVSPRENDAANPVIHIFPSDPRALEAGDNLLDDPRIDPTERARVLGNFLASLQERTAAIETALAGGNAEELRQAIHRLAGTAGRFGFAELCSAGRALEARLHAGEPIAALAAAVEAYVSQTRRVAAEAQSAV